MMLNLILSAFVIFHMILITTCVYKYDIVFKDESIFSPCDAPNVHYIYEYFDRSNILFEFLSNGSLYIQGSILIPKDFGTQDNPLSLQVFKKDRNNWVSTIYNMFRQDFCKAGFDPTEHWYKYVKNIPLEDRTCPLHKGKNLYFNDATDLTLATPNPRLAGDYKVQFMIRFKELNETGCANAFVEVYRH